MSQENLINEQVNRLAYIQKQPEIASGMCGPFQVSVFADSEYELGRPESYAVQDEWEVEKNPYTYFSGIAVRITKPEAQDATGLEFFYTPVIDPKFSIAERVEWRNPKGSWVDVTEPFSFVTSHSFLSPHWVRIHNSPLTVPKGQSPSSFWTNQFVYALPFANVLEHVSRYAETGDHFRIIKPHPVELRWQGQICTIPIPDVEFRVTGRERG